ncbi:S8 family serine peptidase [Tessaracoccus sp. HDW20]|nr:S8/S53 family peptidase [Tessaracoccus coleopterorum]NHB84751.1 S8 family serine peptidase [Tessaracoccus coleopterorum]
MTHCCPTSRRPSRTPSTRASSWWQPRATRGRPSRASLPRRLPGVIGVGISNQQDAGDPATYPSHDITVGAPGRSLVALRPSKDGPQATLENQAYLTDATGTSYAAPVVTGIVALLLQYERDVHDRRLTPAEVKRRLIATADRPAVPLPDSYLGYGIVNPMRALTDTTSETATSATATPAPTRRSSSRARAHPGDLDGRARVRDRGHRRGAARRRRGDRDPRGPPQTVGRRPGQA